MRTSGGEAPRLHRTTTAPIANHSDTVSEMKLSTEPFTADTVSTEEIFLGRDVAGGHHVAARLVLGEDVKPRENMTTATLLARMAKWRNAGATMRCVDEAGPMSFALADPVVRIFELNPPSPAISETPPPPTAASKTGVVMSPA